MISDSNREGSTASVYEKPKRKRVRGVIRHLGTEWILMRVETLQGMRREVCKALGTGANVVCYLAGKGAGKSLAELLQRRTKSGTIQEAYEKVAEIYERCGWGVMQSVMFRQKTGEFLIRIHNNAFSRGIRSRTSSCYYLKGLLEGILEQLTGKCARSEETKCMTKGDEYCEFIVVLK
jgi:predicted hydrocarbon binding protein